MRSRDTNNRRQNKINDINLKARIQRHLRLKLKLSAKSIRRIERVKSRNHGTIHHLLLSIISRSGRLISINHSSLIDQRLLGDIRSGMRGQRWQESGHFGLNRRLGKVSRRWVQMNLVEKRLLRFSGLIQSRHCLISSLAIQVLIHLFRRSRCLLLLWRFRLLRLIRRATSLLLLRLRLRLLLSLRLISCGSSTAACLRLLLLWTRLNWFLAR